MNYHYLESLTQIDSKTLCSAFSDGSTIECVHKLLNALLECRYDEAEKCFKQLDSTSIRILQYCAAANATYTMQAPSVDKIVICDSLLSKEIFGKHIIQGATTWKVAFPDAKQAIHTASTIGLTVTYTDTKSPIYLTAFDRCVFNAIVTMYMECLKQHTATAVTMNFSSSQVARLIAGKTTQDKVSKALIKAVDDSINLMSRFKVSFDASVLCTAWHISDISGKSEGMLLPVQSTCVTFRNGISQQGYSINTIPVVAKFDYAVSHLKTIAGDWLKAAYKSVSANSALDDTSDTDIQPTSDRKRGYITQRHIVIVFYLGLRVAQMKYEKSYKSRYHSVYNKINIEQLYKLEYDKLNTSEITDSMRFNIRAIASGILTNWKSAGIITRFDMYRQGDSDSEGIDDKLIEEIPDDVDQKARLPIGGFRIQC